MTIANLSPLDRAILWTLVYGDIFDFPMTAREIHHFMIERPATLAEVTSALAHPSPMLAARLDSQSLNGQVCYALAGRAETVFATRQQRAAASAELWPQARRYARLLGTLPFVRMVAVTGALSMHNATPGDDLDYLLVVEAGRVWLARLLAVGLVKVVQRLGVTLCPNYVLSEAALVQDKQDNFIAHELAQMQPIVGHSVYQAMRYANDWTARFLPNATGPFCFTPDESPTPGPLSRRIQASGEWVLRGWLGDRLEHWERNRKIRKFSQQVTPSSSARLDSNHVKGHFDDHGWRVRQAFQRRLERYNLPAPAYLRPNATPHLAAHHVAQGAAD